ncbi:hypothetical protein E1263_35445 [Kribbella antibiotica]|uniref:Uncharacterized protein n=1 Tax=Kribbella antibiotica TaxID=190195 RepID=A0A4R4YPG4_9ACTN|nr:hypothetical protein [Kribbella antibiotica]TDD46991.1 hypothetical protein E1263_35445 [Kribbella antibiotica]
MRLIHRAGSCDNGPCPNVFDTDDGDLVAIQGAELLDPNALAQLSQMPAHETVVLVPRALLIEYARKVQTEVAG